MYCCFNVETGRKGFKMNNLISLGYLKQHNTRNISKWSHNTDSRSFVSSRLNRIDYHMCFKIHLLNLGLWKQVNSEWMFSFFNLIFNLSLCFCGVYNTNLPPQPEHNFFKVCKSRFPNIRNRINFALLTALIEYAQKDLKKLKV